MGNASCGNVKYADQDFLRAVQDGHELGVLHHILKGSDVNRRSRCHQVSCKNQSSMLTLNVQSVFLINSDVTHDTRIYTGPEPNTVDDSSFIWPAEMC